MEKKIKGKQVFKMYWQMLKGFRWPLVIIYISIALAAGLALVYPWLYKQIFDALASGGNPDVIVHELIRFVVGILVLEVITWVSWRVSGYGSAMYHPRAGEKLRNSAFEYLIQHSYRFFTNKFAGSLVRQVNRFAEAFSRIGDKVQWGLLPMAVHILGIGIILWWRSWILGFIVASWIVFMVLLNILLARWKLKYDSIRAELDSKATGTLADIVTNALTVKLFASHAKEAENFANIIKKRRKAWGLSWMLSESITAIQSAFMIALEFGVLWMAVKLWSEGVLTIGDFALIQGYLITLFHTLWDMGRNIREIYESTADASEMTEILEEEHEVSDVRSAKPLVVKGGEIRFENVGFAYHKTRRILKDFNLTIKPGERVALVGPSGAGKSTVTKLLFRFFDVTKGKIYIDGQKTARATQESLWQSISLVPQEPILFHRSLMDNIRYGRPEASDEEVVEAAKKARCHDFIQNLPETYETFVGERGVKLSGGERQRVAIARAILKNAPILVLDEATSSLDSESEFLIQEALDTLMKGKTTIVIAHRLSTIMKMDRIIVMEEGEIIDQGTHKQLTSREGVYKKLWEIQAGGFV